MGHLPGHVVAGWAVGALFLSLVAPAGAEPVATIVSNGDPANRVDVVVLGDGYTAAEMAKYQSDVAALVAAFFAQDPLREYQRFFNVHRIDVVSNQSGADHPERGVQVDTALGASYDCGGIQRLVCVDQGAVTTILSRSLAANQRDIVVVLVNDPEYGGAGGAVAVASTNPSSAEILLHELGHSFGLLADEYDSSPPPCDTSVEPPEPNVTRETRRGAIKWVVWIDPATPVPTTAPVPGVPGLYAGAKYCVAGLSRPTYDSKMRSLGRPYEQINAEQFIKRIYNVVSPIDAVAPATSAFSVAAGTPQAFSVTTPEPLSQPLEVTWLVDGVSAGSGETFSLNTAGLSGAHTVTVRVRDLTSAVRNDPGQVLSEQQSWTVTVTSPQAAPTARVAPSGSRFRVGETLIVGLDAANPTGNPPADLYVGAILPDGRTTVFFSASGGVAGAASLDSPAAFRPMQSAPPGFTLSRPAFFQITFPATGVVPGTYQVFAALVRSGMLADGRMDPGDVVALDVKPVVFSP